MATHYAKEVKANHVGSQSGPDTGNVITCIGASSNNQYRSYFQYDLSGIPYKSVITSAKLKMRCQSHYAQNYTALFNVARVTADWEEDDLSWDSLPASEGEYLPVGACMVDPEAWTDWEITELVQSWVDMTYANHGLQVVYPNEDTTDAEWWVYNRRQFGDGRYATYIEIEYEPAPEVRITVARLSEISDQARRLSGSTNTLSPKEISTVLSQVEI